jgi:chromosomal replication initiation ATPase DnaA
VSGWAEHAAALAGSQPPPPAGRRLTLGTIIGASTARAGITHAELRSPSRRAYLVAARREIATVARAQGYTWNEIGVALDRDHSSVLMLVRRGNGRS